MKKVFLIGALALGMMSFNTPEKLLEEVVKIDCVTYANNATNGEAAILGFTSDDEELEAWEQWYDQCMSM